MIWNWNERLDGEYPEFIINKVDLVNIKILKCIGLGFSYNEFNLENKAAEHIIDIATGSFA